MTAHTVRRVASFSHGGPTRRHTITFEKGAGRDAPPPPAPPAPPVTLADLRRPAVAVAGGALTAAGIVLIPFPVVPGTLISYGGLLLLATEFEAAQKAVDAAKAPIVKWLKDDDEKNGSKAQKENSTDNIAPNHFAMKQILRKLLLEESDEVNIVTNEPPIIFLTWDSVKAMVAGSGKEMLSKLSIGDADEAQIGIFWSRASGCRDA